MTDASNHPGESPLGKTTEYSSEYDPTLLYPIPRATNRQLLGIQKTVLPFVGMDIWNGYEISWLSQTGLPRVAVAVFVIPADSPNIIESKSFKLYLNSFNQSRFSSVQEVQSRMYQDLTAAVGREVRVDLRQLDAIEGAVLDQGSVNEGIPFELLDGREVQIEKYHRAPSLLESDSSLPEKASFAYVSHLLKSNCPVTGQPDWATIYIWGKGGRIPPDSLLKYIVSFRQQQDFHEHCVETMFMDLVAAYQPDELTVYARYTRRGGLDINPFRSSVELMPDYRLINGKLTRQ